MDPIKPVEIMHSYDFDFIHNITFEKEIENFAHYHDFYEIFIFIHGKGNFNIEGRHYELFPGNILLINYHDVHKSMITSSDFYERMYFWISPSYFTKNSTSQTKLDLCFSKVGKDRSRILPTTIKDIKFFLDKFIKLKSVSIFGADIEMENIFKDFLIYINKLFLSQENELMLNNVQKNELIETTISFISENINQQLTLNQIAEELFVSEAHLSREFKKHTSFTLHKYILKRKLLHAKTLLIENKNISVVCDLCGFSNYSHFIKVFKKEFKITPKQYQLNHQYYDAEAKKIMMKKTGLI